MSDVERSAAYIAHTSIDDGISSARLHSIAVCRRAIQLEEQKEFPRLSLIRRLTVEITRKEREAAREPKEAA